MSKKIYQIRVTEGKSCEGVMDCLLSSDVFLSKEDAMEFALLYGYGSGVKDFEIDEYDEDDIEDYNVVKMSDLNKTFTEYCPHCDHEVELAYEFKIQRCPDCGKLIAPCNLCNHDLCDCANCPLAKLTAKLKY